MSMLRLLCSLTRFSPQTIYPKPSFMKMMAMPKGLHTTHHDESPPKRSMRLGEFILKAAVKKHLSTTYPHLTEERLTALRDINLTPEKLLVAGDRCRKESHRQIVHMHKAGWAFEDPIPDSAISICGIMYLQLNHDLERIVEMCKKLLEPLVTLEELEKQSPEELERLRAASAQALSHRPIKFLHFDEILGAEDPIQRLEELGAYALKVAMSKHLRTTYPELFGRSLTTLRDVNLSKEKLAIVADRFNAKKRKIWASRVKIASKEPMSDSGVVMAGKIYVDVNYDLDKFWMRYKGYMEPIISVEDLENQGVGIDCYPFVTVDEMCLSDHGRRLSRERGQFALRVALKKFLIATYPGLGVGLLDELVEANLSEARLAQIPHHIDFHSSMRLAGVTCEPYDPSMTDKSDYAITIAGIVYVSCNYDLHKFWKGFKKFLHPLILPEDLQK